MRNRKPFYHENRKFTAAKFTFKLSSGAVANRPMGLSYPPDGCFLAHDSPSDTLGHFHIHPQNHNLKTAR